MSRLYRYFVISCALFGTSVALGGPLKIVAMNPIAADWARQLGGDEVDVRCLMPVTADPHQFAPGAADLKAASDADLVLVMGKGLESWLDELRASLPARVTIIELGDKVPSLNRPHEHHGAQVEEGHHHHGTVDPHWWHSISRVRRALRSLSDEMQKLAPEQADYLRERRTSYDAQLQDLEQWARLELSRIPADQRKLATAHLAFNYLCDDMGLSPMAVKGLTTEEDIAPEQMAQLVQRIRDEHLIAVFPEATSNRRITDTLARETGVRIGPPLLAGSLPPDAPYYLSMMRRNIQAISDTLSSRP